MEKLKNINALDDLRATNVNSAGGIKENLLPANFLLKNVKMKIWQKLKDEMSIINEKWK